MSTISAATLTKVFGDYFILWYSKSNSYSVVTDSFKSLLDLYFSSGSLSSFKSKIAAEDLDANPNALIETLEKYLKDCNLIESLVKQESTPFERPPKTILKLYKLKSKTIAVHFESETLLKLFHPAIAHLSAPKSDKAADTSFDIYIKNDNLVLFKDTQLIRRVPKMQYHHIQGKFIMHMLCTLHDKSEADWIGTFHGSSITDGHSSVLFIGQSGKGKSTLCALLAANGFELLADDVSPMLSENQNIYHNPLALSIKKGSFEVLQPLIPNFEDLETVNFNKSKGQIKYLPCPDPKNTHYPCKAIILVNYTPEAETQLEQISIKTALETLIPESWLSPNPLHAKQFMDWLETVACYQLTYSDTQSVTREVSSLFKTFRKP